MKQMTTEEVMAIEKKRIAREHLKSVGKFSQFDTTLCMGDIADIEERAMIRFILLGDIAKACFENRQEGVDGIDMVLSGKAITFEVNQLFVDTWKFTKTDYGYTYNYTPPLKWDTKIPVRIFLYKEHFKFFDNPDQRMYNTESYYIPNPFNKYWKARHFILAKLEKGMPLSGDKL